jgi:hypothetical protein
MGKPWVELSPRSHRSLQHDIDDVFEAYRVASAVMSNPQLQLLLAYASRALPGPGTASEMRSGLGGRAGL